MGRCWWQVVFLWLVAQPGLVGGLVRLMVYVLLSPVWDLLFSLGIESAWVGLLIGKPTRFAE